MTAASALETRLLDAERRRFRLDELPAAPVVTPAGHTRPYEETRRWIQTIVRRVPITRVFDLSPLDVLDLPIWAAVTPLARDLTVHSGKGASCAASRLSAVMEAMERISAEATMPSVTVRASYDQLRATCRSIEPLDPTLCSLPFESAYSANATISWTLGYDLIERRYRMVARDLVISPAEEGVCVGPETNGLASGNTITEAVVHALYEVIERDALSREYFCHLHIDSGDAARHPIRLTDPSSLPDEPRSMVDRLNGRGLTLRIQDVTSTGAVPAYRAVLLDANFPGSAGRTLTFEGSGSDLDAVRALTRAILEAAQAHSSVVVGARDSFEVPQQRPSRSSTLERHVDILFSPHLRPFAADRSKASTDLLRDLAVLLDRLAADGVRHCVVSNLTRDELAVPVVRVLVPEFAGIYGQTRRQPGLRLLRDLIPFQSADVRLFE